MATSAVKPSSVSAEAVCVPPSMTQPATIASMESSNMHDNAQELSRWANGMKTWAENAERNHEAGQPIPDRPAKPTIHRTQVTYADAGGAVKTGPKADDGQYYAWVETVIYN